MSYESHAEIENIVRGFEQCQTPKEEFKHREHLVLAVWYVETLGRHAALERMRSGLMRFLDHHGVDKKKYNEAVTVFWISRVAERLEELGTNLSLVERCNTIVGSEDFRPQLFAERYGLDS